MSNWLDEVQVPQKIVKENLVKIQQPTADNPRPVSTFEIDLRVKPQVKKWSDGKQTFYFSLTNSKLLSVSEYQFNELIPVLQRFFTGLEKGKVSVESRKQGKLSLIEVKPILA